MKKSLFRITVLAAWAIHSGTALSERADRDKPVNLEADRVTVDDAKKVHIFEGNVILTQGTLTLNTERMVVTQDAAGFQRGVATGGRGGLARFRQKREASHEYVEGEAERIEYDSKAEKAEFFTRGWVRSGKDEVRGDYIQYDGMTERYFAAASPQAASSKSAPPTSGGRVRATIQPKTGDSK